MKLLWIYSSYENLGVEMLSAALKRAGHSVDLVLDPRLFDDHFVSVPALAPLFSFFNRVVAEVPRRRPDAVLFSLVSDDFPWFRRMAAAIREALPVPIIAGGIHITSAPREAMLESCLDYGIIGEGDVALPSLLDAMASGGPVAEIPNLVFRAEDGIVVNPPRALIENLDELPFADKEIFAHTSFSPSDMYTITCSRGCPFQCTFCNSSLMHKIYGKIYFRRRSTGNVMEELGEAKSRYNPRVINFLDETFGVDKKWLAALAEAYGREIGVPCIACTNPNIVTKEHAALLKQMRCMKVDIGIQTINEGLKHKALDRRETAEQSRMAIELLQAEGIKVAAENIINLPFETEEDLAEMARFYNTTRPDILKIFWIRYYPGTRILDIALESGILSRGDADNIARGRTSASLATGGPKPSRIARRFYAFFIMMRLFPMGVNEWLIRRRAYRFLTVGPIIGISYVLLRLLGKNAGREAEIMVHRHKKHFRFYISRWARHKI